LVAQDPKTRSFIPNYEALEKIKEAVDDLNPKQIVIDPIAMFWGNESGGNDMAMALSKAMQHLQMYSNASIDMITHIGKDSHTRKDTSQFSGRGGTALSNHCRVIRTLLKLNEKEYKEETGLELKQGQTAILCNIGKFSDGSPYLDKAFVILRTGYLFERIECIEKSEQDKANDVSKEKDTVYQWLKTNSTEARPVTQKDLTDVMVLSGIKKTVTRSVVTILKLEKLVEEVPHTDGLVGEWLRVR
jgi:RecA-family ATPase